MKTNHPRRILALATLLMLTVILVAAMSITASASERSAQNGYDVQPIAEACSHVFVKTVVSPTCTEQGYTDYACSKCDLSYTIEVT